MKQYLDLMKKIKDDGVLKPNRTGVDTYALFGEALKFNLQDGFPLVTTKRIHLKSVIHELLWFLGCHMKDERYSNLPMTNIKYLTDNGVSIWNEWADSEGNLGKVYGYQWTHWEKFIEVENGLYKKTYINQIDELINKLINKPEDRRMMVTAWNPAQLDEMNLPPCHYGFQCYSVLLSGEKRRELFKKWIQENKTDDTGMSVDDAMEHFNFPKRELHLAYNQRSNDYMLGNPFNFASYAFLTYMLAHVTNHVVGGLTTFMGDVHLYVNHFEYINEQLTRTPRPLPQLKIKRKVDSIYDFKYEDFEIVGYDPYPNWKNVPIAV